MIQQYRMYSCLDYVAAHLMSNLSVTTSTSKIQVIYCILALYPEILHM